MDDCLSLARSGRG